MGGDKVRSEAGYMAPLAAALHFLSVSVIMYILPSVPIIMTTQLFMGCFIIAAEAFWSMVFIVDIVPSDMIIMPSPFAIESMAKAGTANAAKSDAATNDLISKLIVEASE